MDASRGVVVVRVNDASKHPGGLNRGEFHRYEAGAIAAVAEEEFFEANIGIGEGAVLRLEEWAEAPTWCDDVKLYKEVVVCYGNDAVGSSVCLMVNDGLCGGIIGIAFAKA